MLSDTKIIALFCIVDDMLQGLHHQEDQRVRVHDSEIITTAFVSVLYFGGHLDNGCHFMKFRGYVPGMLQKSRFCRRLHRLKDLLMDLFTQLGQHLKDMAGASEYVLDSFPLAVCDTMRSERSHILKGKHFYGRSAAFRRYFYGVKVQVLTLEGIPVEFCLTPGRDNDTMALHKLPFHIAPESCIYADAGYTDYKAEDLAFEAEMIHLMVVRKSNSHRKDSVSMRYIKDAKRKQIETTFSIIKSKMLKSIHAVTQQGFLIKVALFVIAFSFDKITN